MKTLIAVALLLFAAIPAFAQPDPRDSVIIENKTLIGGLFGSGVVLLKVAIRNKDTLTNFTLPLEIKTIVGTAFIVIGYPRTFSGSIHRLTPTLGSDLVFSPLINNASPDSAVWSASWDPNNPATAEPPNLFRKELWEIRFDTVRIGSGQIMFDSAIISGNRTGFVNINGDSVGVNFSRGFISVVTHSCLIVNCVAGANVLYGRPYTYDFNTDLDPIVKWSVVTGPGSIDPNTGVYSFSGQCPLGAVPVMVRGTDTRIQLTCECAFTLNIIDNPPSCSPAQNVVTISHGLVVTNQINASDPNVGDGFVFTTLSGPGTVSSSGVWSYTTGCEDVGISPQRIKIKVSDAFGSCSPGPRADTCEFQLVVTNSPPVFTWPTSTQK